jgi:Tfp pilus assembly protein PilV
MTIIEVAVALVILAAAMVALVQLVGLTTRQRRAIHERAAALAEVANQAERLALLPWNEIAPSKLTTWEPSPELTASIPRATCRATVTDESEPPSSRRIELRVTWQNAAGLRVEPALLTVWRFRPEAQP